MLANFAIGLVAMTRNTAIQSEVIQIFFQLWVRAFAKLVLNVQILTIISITTTTPTHISVTFYEVRSSFFFNPTMMFGLLRTYLADSFGTTLYWLAIKNWTSWLITTIELGMFSAFAPFTGS